MNNDYSTNYHDENGSRIVSISPEDSRMALKNDYEEIMRKYDPNIVEITRCPVESGEALHLKVTVHAPSHYLTSSSDIEPKPCDNMTVYIICYPGYPIQAIRAYYLPTYRLASPNVFNSGSACIDNWIPFTSSLITVVEKLVRDMIHDPLVTRYDSLACPYMSLWHRNGVQAGSFPTIPPQSLYSTENRPLPPRRTGAQISTPPSLPRRTH